MHLIHLNGFSVLRLIGTVKFYAFSFIQNFKCGSAKFVDCMSK